MGIKLEEIKDARLREHIERQLCSGVSPAPDRKAATPKQPVKREADLHDEVEALCRQRGYYYIHSRMDRRSTVQVGAPDFLIALPHSRMVWIELKRKGGKPTLRQLAAITHLKKLGHAAAVCDSMDGVLTLMVQALLPA
jgi:hypothetical protein